MATLRNKTLVRTEAPHRVEYEYRSLLGIIGSWREALSTRTGKVSLKIIMSEEPEKVIINNVDYVPKVIKSK